MGKRGPKPKPKAVTEPGPLPDPPDWLDGERALEFWNTYGPTLNRLGLLESLDAVLFAMLCDGFESLLYMREQMAGEPLTVLVGKNGAEQQHPLVSVIRHQTKAIRELLSEFGMTPSSRTALTGSTSTEPITAEVDALEALARQMNETPSQAPEPQKRTAKKKPAKKAPRKRTRKK